MAEESFKERARQEMIKAAKQYKDIYVDYEYLICSVTFEKNAESLYQQGFDKDGSRKPVKSRLCRQQADGAFIKNEYEDGKRRILRFASFSIGLSALP